ncbi:uncharacterized protein BXZ73DRAFT_102951 [Epithele typhae]|uniref:uncharacterized protein n=1 Tax=Epithele typhae TaxID=378194 RepID=UPI002007B5C2|nr:uncharacterized protein BXZ73DRAFT_102951 [Epithele typhae]KAH9926268.1 hypothetical protein BXZ73DRAFT_102951 [Epithele typhae]
MFKQIALLSLAVSSAYAHGFVQDVAGANGISGVSLGVTFNGEVPRDGTTEQPFQIDTPVMKDLVGNPCGTTLLSGSLDINAEMAKISAAFGGLPSIPSNGSLSFTVHQVNADGGGPFTAELNTDATAKTFTALTVSLQPPGVNGVLHNGPANSTMVVEIPAGTKCTGGTDGATCLIRLNNGGTTASVANGAGPFGGCLAVTQSTAAANSTASGKTANGKAGNSKAVKGASRKGGRQLLGRHFYPSTHARREAIVEMVERRMMDVIEREITPMVEKRDSLSREIIAKRDFLSAQLLDEISTVAGTAIDIPVDRLAGHDDASATGGNSTAAAAGALLTEQQATDLKKALRTAVEQATRLLSSPEVDAGAFGQNSDITDKANADSNAAQAAGTTSINAGNAGVQDPNTASVLSLLGQVATASDGLTASAAAATAPVTVTVTVTAGAAAATSTNKSSTKKTGGKKAAARDISVDGLRMVRRHI